MLPKAFLFLKHFGTVCMFMLVLTQAALSQSSSSEHLDIVISKSGVILNADESGLTGMQKASIQQYFERNVQNTSFVIHGGRIHMNLAGETLRSVQAELAAIDPANAEQVDQTMNRTLGRAANIPWADDFDEASVLIGQTLNGNAKEFSKLLIVVGSTGDFNGSAENAIIVGSDINFLGNSQVKRSLFTIGSQVQGASIAEPGAQRLDVVFPYDSQAWFKSFAGWGGSSPTPLGTPSGAWPGYLYGNLASFVFALAFGALYLILSPLLNQQASTWLLNKKGTALGLGFLGYLSSLILLAVLVMSLIGILFIPSVVLLILILSAMGYFTVASTIGNFALQRQPLHDLWKFSLGLVLLHTLALVPWLGWFMVQLMAIAGFGALLHTIYTRFQGRRRTPTWPTEPWHRPAFRPKRWKMPLSTR